MEENFDITMPIKEYCDSIKELDTIKIQHLERRLESELAYLAEALRVSKGELEHRLEGMNAFRAQLNEQAATFMTRERFDVEHKILVDKIQEINRREAIQEGKHSRAILISGIAIVISVIIAIVDILMRMLK